jgi:hypothetical protein
MWSQFLFAKTDVYLMNAASEILLLPEDKTHISPSDLEAQLVAGAIVAFQENSAKQVNELFLELLEM